MANMRNSLLPPAISVGPALLGAMLVSCEPAGGDAAVQVASQTVESRDGLAGISLEPPLQPVCQARLVLEEVSRSTPEAEFTRIESLDADRAGRIYVAEGFAAQRITVLSPSGDVVRRIGARGAGPGEYQSVTNVQVLPDDRLLVFDRDLNRITLVRLEDGDAEDVINLSQVSALPAPRSVAALPGGRGLLAVYSRSFSPSDNPAEERRREWLLRVLHLDGSLRTDSVLALPGDDMLVVRLPGFVSVEPDPPFGRKAVIRTGPDGSIYVAHTDSLVIRVFSPAGELIREIRQPTEPLRITADEMDAAVADLGEEPFVREFLRNAPRTWPAFRSFLVDDAARVWVARAVRRGGPNQWEVYSSAGRCEAVARPPARTDLRLIKDGVAIGVETDALGVPTVVTYRIRGGRR